MGDCIVERQDGVMLIRFNRPEKMNAMGGTLIPEYNAALDEARADDAVRAIVITGEGRAWCAGADLTAMGGATGDDLPEPPRPERLDLAGSAGQTVLATWNVGKPTIAAVNGAAVGAGMGLASACDFRIASDQARFGTIFIQRALGPDYGLSWFLPRIVGMQRALELQLTGRMFNAAEAKEYGYVLDVVPHDNLVEHAMGLARDLAAKPPSALYYHREAIHRALDATLQAQLEFEWQNQTKALRSEEFQEGVAAFTEKRDPDFSRF